MTQLHIVNSLYPTMWQKIVTPFFLLCSALALTYAPANAQGFTPAEQVRSTLQNQGYTVLAVDSYRDVQGNPLPNVIYVMMQALSSNLNTPSTRDQVLAGFNALASAYPSAATLVTTLELQPYRVLFTTDANAYRQVWYQQSSLTDFWERVRGNVVILDTRTSTYYSSKDFTGPDLFGNAVQTPCSASRFETFLFVQNNYLGQVLSLSLSRDYYYIAEYSIPGDAAQHRMSLQPGRYGYTARVGGLVKGSQPTDYAGGNCYYFSFSP
jgi:hypothetical protein